MEAVFLADFMKNMADPLGIKNQNIVQLTFVIFDLLPHEHLVFTYVNT